MGIINYILYPLFDCIYAIKDKICNKAVCESCGGKMDNRWSSRCKSCQLKQYLEDGIWERKQKEEEETRYMTKFAKIMAREEYTYKANKLIEGYSENAKQ